MAGKKAGTHRTMARALWSIVAAELAAQGIPKCMLAKLAGVSEKTVRIDAESPERIPLARLSIYFKALGIDAAEVLLPIAQAHAERLAVTD